MSNIPGLIQPTVNSYPAGANSPATAAKLINDANNLKLQNINQMAAGSRRRRKLGGGDSVAVPIIKPIYIQQNGPGTDTTSQQAQGQSLSMQSTANSIYDKQATKMGGSRRRYKKGGNPDWVWGCSSGGRRRRTHRAKSKKNKKKSRRHRR
jgi:hypothetical protein